MLKERLVLGIALLPLIFGVGVSSYLWADYAEPSRSMIGILVSSTLIGIAATYFAVTNLQQAKLGNRQDQKKQEAKLSGSAKTSPNKTSNPVKERLALALAVIPLIFGIGASAYLWVYDVQPSRGIVSSLVMNILIGLVATYLAATNLQRAKQEN
ncbi:hypothetical protein [Corynebacterium lizhenjunii]|uniref:hypothetical protein n=1 Tax=Corynebacterium lizhenjunii TaxID=2709394 RepID=UPI0013EB86F2|nr:hypothetical protein [Corynebacterium lizhenjunii]